MGAASPPQPGRAERAETDRSRALARFRLIRPFLEDGQQLVIGVT